MRAAQEMFRQSNKVTRPEKALILGFMAGARGKDSASLAHISQALQVRRSKGQCISAF